jgi:hypothetical protein
MPNPRLGPSERQTVATITLFARERAITTIARHGEWYNLSYFEAATPKGVLRRQSIARRFGGEETPIRSKTNRSGRDAAR